MPNLEQHAVAEWLAELLTGSATSDWPPVMRQVEMDRQVAADLASLGGALDGLAGEDLPRLAGVLQGKTLQDDLRTVLAQLGAARPMRLLHWMAEVDVPDFQEIIAKLMREDIVSARALRASVAAVTRIATVHRMVAPERVSALEAACAIASEET